MIPLLRLADLRDLTDAELRRHIFDRYMVPTELLAEPTDAELAQRIGTVLVAYESVGDWGCDSAAYFLLERDGELYEVQALHDSTCGFEGQWEPRPVTPSYIVSEHWRMSVGGYDEHRGSHPAWDCDTCEGEGYVFAEYGYTVCRMCDGTGRKPDAPATDLSTRDVVRAWLHHRFGGELAEQPFALPEWAIPTWARHVDKQGDLVDLRAVDDRYLLNIVRWACRKVRKHWHEERYMYIINNVPQLAVVVVGQHTAADLAAAVIPSSKGLFSGVVASRETVAVFESRTGRRVGTFCVGHREPHARGSFLNAMREAEARGLLPTWDELRIAGDVAELRGAMVHRPIAADEVACVPIEGGPWDLVDLWVGYGVRDNEA